MAKIIWTKGMEARLREAAKDKPLDRVRCQEIASELLFSEAGIGFRNIIAFARKNGIPFVNSEAASTASELASPSQVRPADPPNTPAEAQQVDVAAQNSGPAISSGAKIPSRPGGSNILVWIGVAAIVGYLIYALGFYQDDSGGVSSTGTCQVELESCLKREPESRWENYCQPEYYKCLDR